MYWSSCLNITTLLFKSQSWIYNMITLAISTSIWFSLVLHCLVYLVLDISLGSINTWFYWVEYFLLILNCMPLVMNSTCLLFNLNRCLSLVSNLLTFLLVWFNNYLFLAIGIITFLIIILIKHSWSPIVCFASGIVIWVVGCCNRTLLSSPSLS